MSRYFVLSQLSSRLTPRWCLNLRETVRGRHGVGTGSDRGRKLAHDPGSRSRDPVATAPGTDLILKLRHYRIQRILVRAGAIQWQRNTHCYAASRPLTKENSAAV